MNRAPSLLFSITVVAAALVFWPFGEASGSGTITATHQEAGVSLHGNVELQDPNASFEISCGEWLVTGATDVITTETDFTGTIDYQGRTLRAVTEEAQFVQQAGAVVCIDAEGTIVDDDGHRVADWHLRPNAEGIAELHVSE